MPVPNRKDIRDTLYGLINTLAGAGQPLSSVINGQSHPAALLNGESPVVTINSGGSDRPWLVRGTAQNVNKFLLAVTIWVAHETTDVDDVADDIERELWQIFSDNRAVEGVWHMLTVPAATERRIVAINGKPYSMETIGVLIEAYG